MKSDAKYFALALLFALLPLGVHAQVSITEIMYDLEGTDSGREWIEVQNSSTGSVDLSTWTFFEGDTNHKLSAILGTGVIAAGAYAVIADNVDAFRVDWPGFSGTLLDSAFSLSNTGELLTLRNAAGVDVDSVMYSADWGAAGDGNTLNLESGVWVPSSPTPLAAASQSTVPPVEDTSGSDNGSNSNVTQNTGTSGSPASSLPEARYMTRFEAGSDRTVTVGAAEFFKAYAYDQNGDELSAVTYTWNFGNGVVHEGKQVLHQYNHPGSYAVSIIAKAPREYIGMDRFTVKAEAALLRVTEVAPQHVGISNDSNREIDLSMWSIRSGEKVFQIPHGTIMLPGNTLRFSSEVTGLMSTPAGDVALLYPSGQEAHRYSVPQTQPARRSAASAQQAISTQPLKAQEPAIDVSTQELEVSALSAVGAAGQFKKEGNLYLWLLALVVLLVIAIGGLLFVRAKEETYSEASEYNIVDDTTET